MNQASSDSEERKRENFTGDRWEQARSVISKKLLLPSHELWASARMWVLCHED